MNHKKLAFAATSVVVLVFLILSYALFFLGKVTWSLVAFLFASVISLTALLSEKTSSKRTLVSSKGFTKLNVGSDEEK